MGERPVDKLDYSPIGVIASRHGVSLRTLRFYEEKGLLSPLRLGVQRLYSPKDEIKIRLVRIGARLGFTLEEIRSLIDTFIARNSGEPESVAALLDPQRVRKQIAKLEQKRAHICEAIDELKAPAHETA